jgi:NAD(P)-dependent dehydrogenase (short-subunit alcohol dehydrogenase family)
VGVVSTKRTEDLPVAEWRRVVDVNLTGMWQTSKYFLPLLRDSGNGVVINISSLAGLMAGGQAIAYSTTKAAVNALTRSLALEYAPQRVRVNCIAPGMVDTPLGVDDVVRATGQSRDDVVASRSALIPMGRQGTAWDVARAALFLASDEASFITGVVLPVDGGSSLGMAPPPRTKVGATS